MKFNVIDKDKNNNEIVLNTFDNIIDAYLSVDINASVFKLTDVINKINSCEKIQDFEDYVNLYENLKNNYFFDKTDKITDIYIIITRTSTEEDTIKFFIKNEENPFLNILNNQLQELEFTARIVKDFEYIKNDIKNYLINNLIDFLAITNLLIENNLYESKYIQSINVLKINNIVNDITTNLEIIYDVNYNEKDKYKYLDGNVIYSETEYDVLQHWINDIDLIVTIINDNLKIIKPLLNTKNNSQQLIDLLNY